MTRYSKRVYSIMPYIEKAKVRYDTTTRFPDGSIASGIIWKLPETTKERPHGYKYRLNYRAADGTTIFRLDNKSGKGDHQHIYDKEFPYTFQNLDVLLADFEQAIEQYRKRKEYE